MRPEYVDALYFAGLNASIAGYGGIIAQCENQELRETIQQMRNQDELRQYELFKKAKEKLFVNIV